MFEVPIVEEELTNAIETLALVVFGGYFAT
jgi:hypothetical protein